MNEYFIRIFVAWLAKALGMPEAWFVVDRGITNSGWWIHTSVHGLRVSIAVSEDVWTHAPKFHVMADRPENGSKYNKFSKAQLSTVGAIVTMKKLIAAQNG